MSHVSNVKCNIRDLTSLGEAAAKHGGELMVGQTSFRMYGSQKQPCLHAIRIKGDKE